MVPALSIIMNVNSGHHGRGHEIEINLISQRLEAAGFDVAVFLTSTTQNLTQVIQHAISRHQNMPSKAQGMIVAAGGDGTINAVAQALIGKDVILGILPLGTFNYVARVLNIPIDLPAAVENLVNGVEQLVHVGSVNGEIYLNNASIGVYPVIIEQREYYNKKFGRFPIVAYISGLSVLLKPQHYHRIKMKIDGEKYPIETPMIFFGNNQLQLQDLKLSLASCAAAAKLAGVAIGKVSHWQLFKLMIQLFRGEVEQAKDVHAFCAENVEISSKHQRMKVALDGEIKQLETPLHFKILRSAIRVRVPHAITSI